MLLLRHCAYVQTVHLALVVPSEQSLMGARYLQNKEKQRKEA
jgi:hypothetical protein